MGSEIVVAGRTRFCLTYSTLNVISSVRPFISKVADFLSTTRDIEQSVLRAADLFPVAANYFVIEPGHIGQTFGLREQYLFGKPSVSALKILAGRSIYDLALTGSNEDIQDVSTLIYLTSIGLHSRRDIASKLGDEAGALFEEMITECLVVEGRRYLPTFAPCGVPGVFRLQHASLLYRTINTGILVDPHLHSSYGDIGSDIYRDHLNGKVDAILISHYHEDHFFLSTLLMFSRDIPIVVPKVPRATVICDDMQQTLRNLGFTNIISVDWHSAPLRFGDVEVFVLPFFGEQPLRFESSKHADLRNWGNTYLIRTHYYTSWFLIDSGSDAMGSMIELAHSVRAKFGRIDIVLSNLRRFSLASPLYINGGLNWLTLSPRQIQNFRSMQLHCITLGPEGVAEICQIVEASYYLPYAHWWGNLGSIADSGQDTPGQTESNLLRELAELLVAFGAVTKINPWNIGDGFIVQTNGTFTRLPL